MSSFRSFLRRLEKLERALQVDDAEPLDMGPLWDIDGGGLWGHKHIIYHPKEQCNECFPCSDEEEIRIMGYIFEDYNHRYCGQGEELSFPDFLEHFDYLGPKSLAEQRKVAIQKLREEANRSKRGECS